MILIYQMAKVGSLAWAEAVRPAAEQAGSELLHVHFMGDRQLAALEEIVSSPREPHGLVTPLVALNMVRKGRRIAPAVAAAMARGEPMRVITGVRDPVARSLSLLTFFADFCGRAGGGVSARDGASAEQICAHLSRLWDWVLQGGEPVGGFDRLLCYLIGAYRSWFEDELGELFGVDLLAAPGDAGPGPRRLDADGLALLAYRVEDMPQDAPGHEALIQAASALLDAPGFLLPAFNTASTRRSYPLHAEVAQRFCLPREQLDAIYDAAWLKGFYTPGEIDDFKRRWQGGDA